MGQLQRLSEVIKFINLSATPVLIYGRSGSGKSWLGRQLAEAGLEVFHLDNIGSENEEGKFRYSENLVLEALKQRYQVYVGIADGFENPGLLRQFTPLPIVPDFGYYRATCAAKFVDSIMNRKANREYRVWWFQNAFVQPAALIRKDVLQSLSDTAKRIGHVPTHSIEMKHFIQGVPLKGWDESDFQVSPKPTSPGRVLGQALSKDKKTYYVMLDYRLTQSKPFISIVGLHDDGTLTTRFGYGHDAMIKDVWDEIDVNAYRDSYVSRTMSVIIPRYLGYIAQKMLDEIKNKMPDDN
jgi:hypothetical protein